MSDQHYFDQLNSHQVPQIAITNLKKVPQRSNTPKYKVKQSTKSDTLYHEALTQKKSSIKKKVTFNDKNLIDVSNQIDRQKTPKAEHNIIA